jgi:hypothetical protein
MLSDILVCERSAHPVLLHCLQDIRHDWRPLQLVNTSTAAAFRHYKVQVADYTAQHQLHLEMRQQCVELKALSDAALVKLNLVSFDDLFRSSIPVWRMFDAESARFDWGSLPASEAGVADGASVIEVD